MLEELGAELRAVRTTRGRSLQDVAAAATISVAYLQKLEAGHVGAPSPHVLRRLAAALEIGYERLMALAGYVLPAGAAAPAPSLPAALAGEDLTAEEWRAVAAFVGYLKAQRPRRR